MGCLSRLGCGVAVVAVGGVAVWLYGDQLPSQLSRVGHTAVQTVNRLRSTPDTISPSRAAGTDSANAGRAELAWARVAPLTGDAANPLAKLSQRNGPAFITLGAGDLSTVLAGALPSQLPPSTSALFVALDGRDLHLRAIVDASDIAGDGTLGRMLGIALSGRDTVELAGTVDYVQPKVAQYRVEQLRVKGISVPPRLIPTFMRALRRGSRPDSLADNALLLPLPASVADLRVANGKLILYKAVSTP